MVFITWRRNRIVSYYHTLVDSHTVSNVGGIYHRQSRRCHPPYEASIFQRKAVLLLRWGARFGRGAHRDPAATRPANAGAPVYSIVLHAICPTRSVKHVPTAAQLSML